jgi:hypothetical protein
MGKQKDGESDNDILKETERRIAGQTDRQTDKFYFSNTVFSKKVKRQIKTEIRVVTV